MATTPQTNASLAQIAVFLRERDDFVVCGHVSPDGDCLGSQLGLASALRQLGKRVTCVLARNEPLDESFFFMPGAEDMVPAARFEGPCSTFVAVDVPKRERLGDAARLLDAARDSVTIDHHAYEPTQTDLVHVDPDMAATTMLVWRLAWELGVERAGDVALSCYAGLVTDTGRFQFQNTDAAALQAAAEMVAAGADAALVARNVYQSRSLASIQLESRAVERMRFSDDGAFVISWVTLDDFRELGAVRNDAEELVNVLRSVKGVRVACILREQGDQIRGSFRAKEEVDVSVWAREFDGGGHKAAAGFRLPRGPMEQAVQTVWDRVVPELCSPGA